jgi:hypothetical protein
MIFIFIIILINNFFYKYKCKNQLKTRFPKFISRNTPYIGYIDDPLGDMPIVGS